MKKAEDKVNAVKNGGVAGLSQEEVGNGLKEALNIGLNEATQFLSAKDGYFKSPYKILPNLSADYARSFDCPDPRGCLFYATRGGGSWSVPADRPHIAARRLDASREQDISAMRVCESVEAAHSRIDDTGRIVEYLAARGTPARLDSQCKYAVVARGQAEAYLRLPTRRDYVEKIWDHAAGMIIAEEASAIVTDVLGRPLDFSKGTGLSANRGVLCASRAFHGRIRQAIASLGLCNES